MDIPENSNAAWWPLINDVTLRRGEGGVEGVCRYVTSVFILPLWDVGVTRGGVRVPNRPQLRDVIHRRSLISNHMVMPYKLFSDNVDVFYRIKFKGFWWGFPEPQWPFCPLIFPCIPSANHRRESPLMTFFQSWVFRFSDGCFPRHSTSPRTTCIWANILKDILVSLHSWTILSWSSVAWLCVSTPLAASKVEWIADVIGVSSPKSTTWRKTT